MRRIAVSGFIKDTNLVLAVPYCSWFPWVFGSVKVQFKVQFDEMGVGSVERQHFLQKMVPNMEYFDFQIFVPENCPFV